MLHEWEKFEHEGKPEDFLCFRCKHCKLVTYVAELQYLDSVRTCPASGTGAESQENQPPACDPKIEAGYMEMVFSAGRAMYNHAMRGFQNVDPIVSSRRFAVCQTCPAFRRSDSRCAECGCQMNWKVHQIDAYCPRNLW